MGLIGSLVAVTVLAGDPPPADLFIRSERVSTRSVEGTVGNAGGVINTGAFEAAVEVRAAGTVVCRASTNFVTPLDPGTIVRTFLVDVSGARSGAPPSHYTVRFSIVFLDGTHAADANGDNNEQTISIELPRGDSVRCRTLKPRQ